MVRQGGGASDRKTKIRYALSEAVSRCYRELLSEARVISLMRDGRQGNLSVRFQAMVPDTDLTSIKGTLGAQKLAGSAESTRGNLSSEHDASHTCYQPAVKVSQAVEETVYNV